MTPIEPVEALEEKKETVINLVTAHDLMKIAMDKKEFMTLIKAYFKKLEAKLNDVDPDKAKAFKARQPKIAKWFTDVLFGNFKEFEFYVKGDLDESMIIPARYIGAATAPVFYYFADGLKQEKT